MTDTTLESLNALRRAHYVSEDCWYSCPKSGECCKDDETECNCEADRTDELVDLLIADFEALRVRIETMETIARLPLQSALKRGELSMNRVREFHGALPVS